MQSLFHRQKLQKTMLFIILYENKVIKQAKLIYYRKEYSKKNELMQHIKTSFCKKCKMKTIIMISPYNLRRCFLHTLDANCMLQSIDDICMPFYSFSQTCPVLFNYPKSGHSVWGLALRDDQCTVFAIKQQKKYFYPKDL